MRRAFFSIVSIAELADAAALSIELLAPTNAVDQTSMDTDILVHHPWPMSDQPDSAELPLSVKQLREGIAFSVEASPESLPRGSNRAVYVSLFSFSYMISKASTEQWLQDNGLPGVENHLRLSTLFSQITPDGRVEADGLGDVCVGEAFKADVCARVTTCFNVGVNGYGGGAWRFAVPVRFATNYRIEAYIGEATAECRDYATTGDPALSMHWAPVVAEHAVAPRFRSAVSATSMQFRVLYVNRVNWWWGQQAAVKPTTTWAEMMGAAVQAAADSIAASPADHGLSTQAAKGLWLEFGVASGMSTAFIAATMRSFASDEVKLHGFDSFEGLPSSWDYTKVGVGAFSRGGQVPEHLFDFPNIQVHVGLFSQTLADLDEYGSAPVAFAHVDVDIYPSAIEVLTKIACQLHHGAVLVFDEMVNYDGFELSGEYVAWEYIAAKYQIEWQYAGLVWQQAVPILIVKRGRVC